MRERPSEEKPKENSCDFQTQFDRRTTVKLVVQLSELTLVDSGPSKYQDTLGAWIRLKRTQKIDTIRENDDFVHGST